MKHAKNYDSAVRIVEQELIYKYGMIKEAEFKNLNQTIMGKDFFLFYKNKEGTLRALAIIEENSFKLCTIRVTMQELIDSNNDIWAQEEDWL